MYARKVKKICSVRGCKNTESFAIAKTRSEIGNVIICASCLAEALSSVDECRKEYDEKVKAVVSSAPAELFYHPEKAKAVSEAADEVVNEAENEVYEAVDDAEAAEEGLEVNEAEETDVPKTEEFICPVCGKVFASEKSLKAHIARAHKE